jgi:hypothetical protein
MLFFAGSLDWQRRFRPVGIATFSRTLRTAHNHWILNPSQVLFSRSFEPGPSASWWRQLLLLQPFDDSWRKRPVFGTAQNGLLWRMPSWSNNDGGRQVISSGMKVLLDMIFAKVFAAGSVAVGILFVYTGLTKLWFK